MIKQYLAAGKFVTTHGLQGELKAYPYCDSAGFLCGFARLYPAEGPISPWLVESARVQKGMALLKLRGVDSPEAAGQLVGRLFYIDRADARLPAGRWFIQDLLGLQVKDADTGRVYGTITQVTNAGASDIYWVATPGGGTVLFPAAPEFVARLDPPGGVVEIRPIGGMFEDAD